VRLFVALRLSDATRQAIAQAIDRFPVTDPPWRWVDASNWHITLKFMGETAVEDLDRVVAALHDVASARVPFDLTLADFGGFPNLRRPRALYFGIAAGADPCEALAGEIDAALHAATGLARETRRFRAHVTLARIKSALPDEITRSFPLVSPLSDAVTHVDSFALVESRLQRTGAAYRTVKEFAFSGGRC
jgi:2'-5' RNA ligase